MMQVFVRTTTITIGVMLLASFFSVGKLIAFVISSTFRSGLDDGLTALWLLALFGGAPFFGLVFILLFPGEDGRRNALLSTIGFWVGLVIGAFAATSLHKAIA